MEIALWIVGAMIVICLFIARAVAVFNAHKDWNYFVYRYKQSLIMGCSESIQTLSEEADQNIVTPGECWRVTFEVWRIFPERFFSYKPHWEEIHEKYYLNKA